MDKDCTLEIKFESSSANCDGPALSVSSLKLLPTINWKKRKQFFKPSAGIELLLPTSLMPAQKNYTTPQPLNQCHGISLRVARLPLAFLLPANCSRSFSWFLVRAVLIWVHPQLKCSSIVHMPTRGFFFKLYYLYL